MKLREDILRLSARYFAYLCYSINCLRKIHTSEFIEGTITTYVASRWAKHMRLTHNKENNFKARKFQLKHVIATDESESADIGSNNIKAYSKSDDYNCKTMALSVENIVSFYHLCSGRALSDILSGAS
jgi:hypothetical protein